jgi:hypothetical protein
VGDDQVITHTIPATNRQSNRQVFIEVVTDAKESHAELRLTGALQTLPNGALALAIDNESARALAESMLKTVPAKRER